MFYLKNTMHLRKDQFYGFIVLQDVQKHLTLKYEKYKLRFNGTTRIVSA